MYINKQINLLALTLIFTSFQVSAQQTHTNKPAIVCGAVAATSFLGSCIAKYNHDTMLAKYRTAYIHACFSLKLDQGSSNYSENNVAFKQETKNIDHKARKPYKLAYYGLGTLSFVTATLGGWLWYKNSSTTSK